MKIYLVGGAIRDELLGLPVKEKDWVVVGVSPELLLAKGFIPVGKEFPVFLHPQTHEEYALARTERKVAKGYKGFTFYTEPTVTLKEDLKRRDLTINAMARGDDGELIDPYHGLRDLQQKTLRHISPAFAEDPVRILRVARFAAKLGDFSLAKATNELMKTMVANGEINALVAERVWQELMRALSTQKPARFFDVLNNCGALLVLFPMLASPNRGKLMLERSDDLPPLATIRFAILTHDLKREAAQQLIQKYRVPKAFSELAYLSIDYLNTYKNSLNSEAQSLLHFIKKTDALRRPARFRHFLTVCHFVIADKQNSAREQLIDQVIAVIKNTDTGFLQQKGLKGRAFAEALEEQQIAAIKKCVG